MVIDLLPRTLRPLFLPGHRDIGHALYHLLFMRLFFLLAAVVKKRRVRDVMNRFFGPRRSLFTKVFPFREMKKSEQKRVAFFFSWPSELWRSKKCRRRRRRRMRRSVSYRLPFISGRSHHQRGGDAFRSIHLLSPKYGNDRTSKGVVDFEVLLKRFKCIFRSISSLVLRPFAVILFFIYDARLYTLFLSQPFSLFFAPASFVRVRLPRPVPASLPASPLPSPVSSPVFAPVLSLPLPAYPFSYPIACCNGARERMPAVALNVSTSGKGH